MNIEPLSSFDEIIPLLTDCNLPIADISASLPRFFGIRVDGTLVAVVGLEIYQSVALLRSLAVAPSFRKRGFARELVLFVESNAAASGIEFLFLLTTTAQAFFLKLGYVLSARQNAPLEIQSTAQFAGLCPSSSVLLSKHVAVAV